MFDVAQPLGLLLLPLALVPLLSSGQAGLRYSSLNMLPVDHLSTVVAVLLRLLAAALIVALALGISGVYRSEQVVERIGQGAHMLMLIDSSGSMDRPFVTGNEHTSRAGVWGTYTSKGQIARQLLARYAAARKQDMFAMIAFSGNPISVVPLTEKQAVIQAAIAAGSIERGLATTALGAGLIKALEFFADQPFTGSRIVMLVSDGAAQLTTPIQDRIEQLMIRHRVTLYWIYLRDQHSPGLYSAIDEDLAKETAPEQLVHKFFTELDLPYRAFAAENPQALADAIAEVDQLQNLPIRYQDVIPKRDLSAVCYAFALALSGLLLLASLFEVQSWR